ncbi:glycosyltransferase family protein [Spirosoma koreense]
MLKKNILFISPAFFGYEISIKNALIENGYNVDFFDERSSNNSLLKAIFRVNEKLLYFHTLKYYQDIYRKISQNKYNYFLLIKGETIPESFIKKIKKFIIEDQLIYYTFDSVKNNSANSLSILKYFDRCYSFDFEDVKTYPFFKQKHLFYTKEFVNKEYTRKLYDISFVGTLHSNRFSLMQRFFLSFDKAYVFYYLPAKWYFYFQKITSNEFRDITLKDVNFNKLTKQQVAKIFSESRSVLDIQRFRQSGLTMRTFEVLAAGATLITTNNYIKEADFYDEENIIVVSDLLDDSEINIIGQRIKSSPKSLLVKEYNFEKYYIKNWVTEFFD